MPLPGKVKMSRLCAEVVSTDPPFPHLRIALGIADWPRCTIISREGMAGSAWGVIGAFFFFPRGDILFVAWARNTAVFFQMRWEGPFDFANNDFIQRRVVVE